MSFDFQQCEAFRLWIVFVLEDAAVGDTILHHFMRILPSTQEVDAGASVRDRQNVLVVVLFHDFGAGPDHPFHYLITGFSTVLQEKSAFVFGIQVFALAFEGAEMHFLQAFQALVRHQFVRHNLQCIASALGCGAVGMVKIDIIKVALAIPACWMPSSVKGESHAPWIFLRTLKRVWPWRIKYNVFFMWVPPGL